jgi:hypothetical protein
MAFNRGLTTSRTPGKTVSPIALKSALQKEFLDVPLSPSDYLTQLTEDCANTDIKFGRVELSQSDCYFGFLDNNFEGKGVGCVIRDSNVLHSLGLYENT